MTIVNLAIARRTFRPTLLGKAATMVYVVTGVTALFVNYAGEPRMLVDLCVWTALAITLASGLQYAVHMVRGIEEE